MIICRQHPFAFCPGRHCPQCTRDREARYARDTLRKLAAASGRGTSPLSRSPGVPAARSEAGLEALWQRGEVE